MPLAKWSMLLAGNYRCVTQDGMRTAQEAVHSDLGRRRSVYPFVFHLPIPRLHPADRVPCENTETAGAQS